MKHSTQTLFAFRLRSKLNAPMHDSVPRSRMLSDAAWQKLQAFLPGGPHSPGKHAADNRNFLEAILWLSRTGAPWRDLPSFFGKWNSIYQRFRRWAKNGVWRKLFDLVMPDEPFESVMLDSTTIRAHQHAAGAKGDTIIKRWAARVAVSLQKYMQPSQSEVMQESCYSVLGKRVTTRWQYPF